MSRNSNTLDEIDVFRIVNGAVDKMGGQQAAARMIGATRQAISAQMNGSRRLSDNLLRLAGLRRVVSVHYEFAEDV